MGKYFLNFKEDLEINLKIDFRKSKSHDLKEIFKKKDKANRLSEEDVLKLIKSSFSNLMGDIKKSRGHEYFDNLFNNIAFAKYFPSILDENISNHNIEKIHDRILDTMAGYYKRDIREDAEEKVHYINKRYAMYLDFYATPKKEYLQAWLKPKDAFNISILSFNIRNAMKILIELNNLFEDKKPKKIINILSELLEYPYEDILGEILSSRKKLPEKLDERIYDLFEDLDREEKKNVLLYYAKRDKMTLAKDKTRIRVKTNLVFYLTDNDFNFKEIKSIMKEIIREDITLVDTLDYIIKNKDLFRGQRLYSYSKIENKNKIGRGKL